VARYRNGRSVARRRLSNPKRGGWEKDIPYWPPRTMKALNIQGSDVAACIKTLQMDPQLCFNMIDSSVLIWK